MTTKGNNGGGAAPPPHISNQGTTYKMKLFAYNKTFASITGFNVTNLSAIQFAVGAVIAFALEIAGGITHEKSYFYISLVVAVLVSMPATLEMYVQIDKEEKEER